MTEVFFQNAEGQWLRNQIDLKAFQKRLPFIEARTLKQPNTMVCEMLLDIFELFKQKYINFDSSFVVTDFGNGESNAANLCGMYWSANVDGFEVSMHHGGTLDDIIYYALEGVVCENEIKLKRSSQVVVYDYSKEVTVQKCDESVKAYDKTLSQNADILYCNSLLARTPVADVPALIDELKQMGKFIFLTIPLIPSAGYVIINASTLMEKAQVVVQVPDGSIVLEKSKDGDYILPANITVLSKEQWQQILGPDWYFLPSTDCTAVSAVNFVPSAEFASYKQKIVEKYGFSDQIPFPTQIKSQVEKNQLLSARNAALQPLKYMMKFDALKAFPESDFKEKEMHKIKAFFKAVGLTEGGNLSDLPENWIEKLLSLETVAKSFLNGKEKSRDANKLLTEKFAEIVCE